MNLAREAYASATLTTGVEILFLEVDGPALLKKGEAVLKQGKLRGAVSIPLLNGYAASAMAGFEGLCLESYDVDVATGTSIPNPRVWSCIDGALVHLNHESPLYKESNSPWIRAFICLNRLKLGSLKSRNMGDVIGVIDQPQFDRAFIQGRILSDGRAHLLGSLTLSLEGSPVTLYAVGTAKPQKDRQ
jgi:hypothetical protein